MLFASASTPLALIRALLFCAFATLALPAQAEEHCSGPNERGISQCRAGLATASLQQMVAVQERPQWCWAASIAILFAHYGFQVPQAAIVMDRFGEAADRPADSGEAMTRALSKRWADQQDRSFLASARAADALAGRFELTAEQVVAELAGERPLLVGAQGHAMVLVAVVYERGASGMRIKAATVIDPAPGQGLRQLGAAEMKPTYIAAVQVVSANDTSGGDAVGGEQFAAARRDFR
jgi:hypothetical protein